MTAPRFSAFSLLLMGVLLSIVQVRAAPISWQRALDTTVPTDLITDGTLVEAINAGDAVGATTVNEVTFQSSSAILAGGADLDFLDGQTTLDAAFDQLLGTLDLGGGAATRVTIGGGDLVAGQSYRLQVFFTDLRSCCSSRVMTFGDGEGNTIDLNASGGAGAFGQHATGTFTADDSSQTLTLTTNGFGNAHLTAYQVRSAANPPTIRSFTANPPQIAAGEPAILRWEVLDATAIEISGIGTVEPGGSVEVSPSVTQTYVLTATNGGGEATARVTLGVDVSQLDPVLTEFLASNDDGLLDEDEAASDWIEIYNPNPFEIDLGGYYLTDDPAHLNAWQIPEPTTIPGDGYLIVFASNKDRAVAGNELHTNFALNNAGEYLALTAPDGTTVLGEFAFPRQHPNISYGLDADRNAGYFATPTPGAQNGLTFAGFVADTAFSIDRGFFDERIAVEITSPTLGTTIVHTTDGTEPTLRNGTRTLAANAETPGFASVSIRRTTVLRAAAFKDGLVATNVDTHTYLFPVDISRHPIMDRDVVADPAYRDEVIPALKSIRTLSIVTEPDHLFDPSTGILRNTGGRGRAWERPVSIEFIDPGGGPTYQGDAGLRVHGNGSRGNAKNSLRLLFRAEYGPKKLHYPLFGEDWVTDKFNTIVLRAQNANSWTSNREEDRRVTTFTQDAFAKDLQGAMGHPTAGATFVHLYLNGVYWGLYNPVERPDGSFGEDHFGGDDTDYDALNRRFSVEVLSGTKTFWDRMITHAARLLDSPAEYERLEDFIDIDNLIDYMLVHQFMQTRDGPDDFGHNNMRLVRRNNPSGPFRLYAWDMEYSMIDSFGVRDYSYPFPTYSSSRSGARDITDSIASVYIRLKDNNPEFQLRYADRAHRHLHNGGAMDVDQASTLWLTRANEIESAVICESARWGDERRATAYTRDVEWMAERTRLLTEFFPNRPEHIVGQLRHHGLYPSIDPPGFNRHGGPVPRQFPLEITATSGAIYYTLDGTDPREAWSGAVLGAAYREPIALNQSGPVKARAFHEGEWSALTEAEFIVGPAANASNLVVSEIFYQPVGSGEALEFLELTNISPETIDLTGVHFSDGIDFEFPGLTLLAPNAGTLVVNNRESFEAAYGRDLPIAGEFQNLTALSNAGERITILAADDSPIQDFRYDDHLPWPPAADGLGHSLVLINPASNPDPSLPQNWRASTTLGGNPGTTDATMFPGTVGEDRNHNGIDDLLDYALGPAEGPAGMGISVTTDGTFVSASYPRNLAADDVALTPQWSLDLESWSSLEPEFVLTDLVPMSDGRERVVYSSLPTIVDPTNRAFFRLVAEFLAE